MGASQGGWQGARSDATSSVASDEQRSQAPWAAPKLFGVVGVGGGRHEGSASAGGQRIVGAADLLDWNRELHAAELVAHDVNEAADLAGAAGEDDIDRIGN